MPEDTDAPTTRQRKTMRCPECDKKLPYTRADAEAHALRHWPQEAINEGLLSPEAVERRAALIGEFE